MVGPYPLAGRGALATLVSHQRGRFNLGDPQREVGDAVRGLTPHDQARPLLAPDGEADKLSALGMKVALCATQLSGDALSAESTQTLLE